VKQYHDCMAVREEFSAYLDGELAAEEREGFETHLAGCAECLRELDTLKRVDVAYRGLPAVAAPDGFEADVRDAVRTGGLGSEPTRRPVPRWMGPLVAMASAAAVLIIGVVVLEVRQGAEPEMQMASAPLLESVDTATLMQAAPPAASTPDQGPAGGGEAWQEFARSPEQKQAKAEGAWESLTREAPAEAGAAVSAGREDGAGALADGLAGDAEADAEMRARAEVIGDLPEAAAAATPVEQLTDGADALEAPAPSSPEVRANVGEVVSRRVLRSFKVRADGAWVEAGYAGEPTTELKRGSDALNQAMRQHPNETWDTMLDRTAVQIFRLDGVWYALEGKPADE